MGTGFYQKNVLDKYPMGTRNNLAKITASLTEKELIELNEKGYFLADPLFEYWFKREMM